jgi:hypothetical protein
MARLDGLSPYWLNSRDKEGKGAPTARRANIISMMTAADVTKLRSRE